MTPGRWKLAWPPCWHLQLFHLLSNTTLLHHATRCTAGSWPGPHLGGWSHELVCAESSPCQERNIRNRSKPSRMLARTSERQDKQTRARGDWLTGCRCFVNSSAPASSAETWRPHLCPGRGWRAVSFGVQCSLAFATGAGIGCFATRPGWFSHRTEVTKPRATPPSERPLPSPGSPEALSLPGTGASISWPLALSQLQSGGSHGAGSGSGFQEKLPEGRAEIFCLPVAFFFFLNGFNTQAK